MAADPRTDRIRLSALVALVVLLLAAPADAARLAAPKATAPADGASVAELPPFSWTPVRRADRYEFQIAADAGFNSPVLGRGDDHFFTRNTRATLKKTVPNGRYFWRVRAVTKAGGVSRWTEGRALRKAWTASAALQTPAAGAGLTYPASPLRLSWSPVPGAAHYLVSIASDPLLGSIVREGSAAGEPMQTAATTFTRAAALAPGTFYWGITPVDAQGNKGTPSPVASFTWLWPSTTATRVTDLVEAPEVMDPQFSWDPVPGAARYEVEVNPSQDFAPGSKVCCSSSTVATSLTSTVLFKDNVYYWRVRAIDADGNAGVWNVGPSFTKAFAKSPPVTAPVVKNLRMRDHLADPGTDIQPGTQGYQTEVPIVRWDPVPGASSYHVEVAEFLSGGCNWTGTKWSSTTATTAWTPLGSGWNGVKPHADARAVATDGIASLSADTSYCVRVRPRSDRDSSNGDIYGEYTQLNDGTGASFTFTHYPDGGACTPSCTPNHLGAGDYVLPQTGTASSRTPLFTWRPLDRRATKTLSNTLGQEAIKLRSLGEGPGGPGLAVSVQDAGGALDRLVVFAGGVADETFTYADGDIGALATAVNHPTAGSDWLTATLLTTGTSLAHVTQAPFLLGKTAYFVLVAKDASFSNIVDYAFTHVPAYAPRTRTGSTTYSDETTLYHWVVLPAILPDGDGVFGTPLGGATSSFHKQSSPPVLLGPPAGAVVPGQPTFRWSLAEGARRYRIQVAQDPSFGNPIEDVVTSSTEYTSTTTHPADTVLYWRVRADDENLVGLTWSATGTFQKRLPTPVVTPGNPTSGDFIPTWQWEPVVGAVSYDVSADLPDGSHKDINGLRMPALTAIKMTGTGLFHWRVRANFPKSGSGTIPGPYTAPQPFTRTIGEPSGAHASASKIHLLLDWEPKAGVKNYRVQISSRRDFARMVEDVVTDLSSYAPFLMKTQYETGGRLYWRVAAVDEERNVGAFTQIQEIRLAERMSLRVSPRPTRGRFSRVTVTLKNASGQPVRGATVRASGAGVRGRAARTGRTGKASLRLRPTRRGTLVLRAIKAGFQPATYSIKIR